MAQQFESVNDPASPEMQFAQRVSDAVADMVGDGAHGLPHQIALWTALNGVVGLVASNCRLDMVEEVRAAMKAVVEVQIDAHMRLKGVMPDPARH